MTDPAGAALLEHLRAMPDGALTSLLESRPDLAVPAPHDLTALVGRASMPYSLVRALDQLDLFAVQIMETCLVLDELTVASLRRETKGRAPWAQVEAALGRLEGLALVWRVTGVPPTSPGGPPRGASVRIAASPGLSQVANRPLGLGSPAATLLADLPPVRYRIVAEALAPHGGLTLFDDPDRIAAVLAEAPEPAQEILAALAAGTSVGQVPGAFDRALDSASTNPVTWLMSRGLLLAVDEDLVEMPREVALAVRGRVVPQLDPRPPEAGGARPGAASVDATAAGAVADLLRQASDLLDLWTAEPPTTLRSGGLGVRELRRTAKALALPESTVAVLVTAAHTAGLIDVSLDAEELLLLPTIAYDAWLEEPDGRRWLALASAWLGAKRWPALGVPPDPARPSGPDAASGGGAAAGRSGASEPRPRSVALLSADDVRADAPGLRRLVLAVPAALPPGTAVADTGLGPVLRWHRPYAGDLAPLAATVLVEAALLGITARGALSTPGRLLLAEDASGAAAAMGALLPAPVEEVLVQADHTIVAPGPLRPDLARTLGLLADRESTGAATVFRVTESSLRRAMDAGMSAGSVKDLLTARSRTPVPQSLLYLVDDTARRYGKLRLGAAGTYIRCDDEAHLTELVADRRLRSLGLRRIAPTVLVADPSVSRAMDALRGAGFLPVAESPDGSPLLGGGQPRRAATRSRTADRAPTGGTPAQRHASRASTADLAGLVRRMRAADRIRQQAAVAAARLPEAARAPGSRGFGVTAATLRTLREAAAAGHAVWMSYIDGSGTATERIIEPVDVRGGMVEAYDHLRSDMRTFLVDRIVSVAALDAADTGDAVGATD